MSALVERVGMSALCQKQTFDRSVAERLGALIVAGALGGSKYRSLSQSRIGKNSEGFNRAQEIPLHDDLEWFDRYFSQ
jgi:hypothetical protein